MELQQADILGELWRPQLPSQRSRFRISIQCPFEKSDKTKETKEEPGCKIAFEEPGNQAKGNQQDRRPDGIADEIHARSPKNENKSCALLLPSSGKSG